MVNSLLLSSAEQALGNGYPQPELRRPCIIVPHARGFCVSYWVSVMLSAVLSFPNYTVSWKPK